MNRIIKLIAIILANLTMLFGCISCENKIEDGSTVYYGFITTMEENDGLYVDIPNHGICQLPSFKNGKVQNLTLKENDFIKMEFSEDSVKFLESHPVQISTPVSNITVINDTTSLKIDGKYHILTIEYTENIKYEIETNNNEVGDTISVWYSHSGDSGYDILEEQYCSATIEEIVENSITLRLEIPENAHDFLGKLAGGSLFIKCQPKESETPENPEKPMISLPLEIESMFEINMQEKIWFNYNPKSEFADDSIIITFMKTTTYPELSIDVFNFENAEGIEYLFSRPHNENTETNENYRQIAEIHLKEKGREKVLEAIYYFERISIIKHAGPNYIYHIEEDLYYNL